MADKRISQLVERTDIANNDVLPIVASGATTTNKVTISTIQDWMQENLDVGVTSVGITLGTTGTDVNVTGSPITSSGNITINIPDASATARGVVSTGTQTFAGNKTLVRNINVNGVYVGRGASGGDLFSGIAGNTSVGSSALISITTGFPNTALGSEALRNITTGANNIAIGSEAGKLDAGSGAANATSSSSIYIGNSTKPQSNGNSNEIVIGHASSGNGSNTTTIGNSSTTFNRFFGATLSDSFRLPSDGGGNQVTVFENIGTIHTGSAGSNIFGFNNSNNIFFGKGLSNGGVIQWTNAAVRYYTLPDADGTLALASDLTGYVTLGTAQTITAQKTFSTSGSSDTAVINHGSGSGIALNITKAGNGEGLRVAKTSGSGNAVTITGGTLSAEAGQFSGDLQSATRVIAAASSQSIILHPNNGGSTNRIESVGTLPLALVSAAAITLAAGGTTPQITLATTGAATFTSSVTATRFNLASGSFSYSSFWGPIITGGSGTYSNFALLDPATNGIMWNPTGTLNMAFGGNVGVGTANMGTASNNTILGFTLGSNIQARTAVPQLALSSNIDGDWFSATYKVSNFATQMYLDSNQGTIALRTAPSGTAGNAITWNTPALFIANSGNVGMGTTTPQARLEVKQSGSEIPMIIDSSSDSFGAYTQYQVNNSGGWETGMARAADSYSYLFSYGSFGTSTSKFTLTNTGNATFTGSVSASGLLSTNDRLYIPGNQPIANWFSSSLSAGYSQTNGYGWVNGAGNLVLGTNGVGRIFMTSSGAVGIGTDNPSDILTVAGNINLPNGVNRQITIGSQTNYNYRLGTDGDDFRILEASTTERLRYSYLNTRWNITGGLAVSGSLSKGSGSFKIDHPLPEKKDTHHLVHSFIEGPQADNIYRGKIELVHGSAEVNIDNSSGMSEGTFVLLNGNIQCFTSNESGWTPVKGKVEGNILKIEAQDSKCKDTISWLIIGERIDQHMIDTDWTDQNGKVIVEPLKEQEKPSEILNNDLQNQNQTEDESNT